MGESTKKGFDFKRDSVYVVPPDELRIVGGKIYLHGDEGGDLDDDRTQHVLSDRWSLDEALDEQFVESVYRDGVIEPIVIVKDPVDGVANVVAGRTRVRAARVANVRRKKDGTPLVEIRCVTLRVSGETGDLVLMGVLIKENEHRRTTSVVEKIEKAKFYSTIGASPAAIALAFRVTPSTVDGWFMFDDNATRETKTAVRSGVLGSTAAARVAKVKDPEKQRELLAKILAKPESERSARKVDRATREGNAPLSTRDLKRILGVVQGLDTKGMTSSACDWWDGVEALLDLATGGDVHDRFAKVLSAAGVK